MFDSLKKSFDLEGIYLGHHQVKYKNVPAIKSPFDYVLYQMLIAEVKPDLIIEIGTNKGGTTLYLADLLALNEKGEIHTIDLPGNEEDVLLLQHARIKVFKQGFVDYDTSVLEKYASILVIEDGSHTYDDTLTAMIKFAPFVSLHSYLIVEDGIISKLGMKKKYDGGPEKAIHEFLKTEHQFMIDRKWCDFFGRNTTFNTDGYLKRIA